ncbi:methyltransferase family protein [Alcaligenes sp. SMD-FA]|uniref:methyltransferase family protein n=1 Tax=Alcaligenes sp. SMD-FA TaxID=2991054 RepID=UPI00222623FC|nr:isoprenylcysteine carboxylmethyltransferase family protein [Alcaligenes sp. SMD-FA]UYY85899.1 isoprenylcysteine carboxylmethyltransferase family protein [Alcaligenes sp. SMD-FA]
MSGTSIQVQRNALFYLLTQVLGVTFLFLWLASLTQDWSPLNPLLAISHQPGHMAHEMKEAQGLLTGLIAAAGLSFAAWKLLRLRGQDAVAGKRIMLLGTALFLAVPLLMLMLQRSASSYGLPSMYLSIPEIKPLLGVGAVVAVGAGLLHLYFAGWALNQSRLRWGGLLAGLLCAFLLGLLETDQERLDLPQVFASLAIVWLLGSLAFYPLIVNPKRWSASHSKRATIAQAWEHLASIQVQRRRTLGVFGGLMVVILPFFAPTWASDSLVFQFTRMAGLGLVLIAVLGRCWCMLYLGGHKGSSLISQGPYSISRNPLYLFSLCAVTGMGALSGSLLLGPVLALFVYAVFNNVIDEEQVLLQKVFGQDYQDYCQRVPRLAPRLSLWNSPDELRVSLTGLARTLRDALPYFLIWPVFALAQCLQINGWVPVLLRLP